MSDSLCLSELPDQDPPKIRPGRDPRAVLLSKWKWIPGQTITICFLGGSPNLQKKVAGYAKEWLLYANLKFNFVPGPVADVRIAFKEGGGSWSYVGTDCQNQPSDAPTMNFGWFNDKTSEKELKGTTLHEFGHMLGLVHEHSSPDSPIQWNKQVVYDRYSGAPNNWDKAQIDSNVISKYEKTQTQYSAFDPHSIMLYTFSASLTTNNYSTHSNKKLSPTDKMHIGKMYPFVSLFNLSLTTASNL